MRRHGWGGDIPDDDAAARARILDTARDLICERPNRAPSISEVADRTSITRQTVYRYFDSAQTLLEAAVSEGVDAFLDAATDHLAGIDDVAGAVVEGIAFTYEQLSERVDLALLLGSPSTPLREVTAPSSLALGRSILERLDFEWSALGFDDAAMDEVVEVMLRMLQSLVVDPGRPPRTGVELRAFLYRWIAPAVAAVSDNTLRVSVESPVVRRGSTSPSEG